MTTAGLFETLKSKKIVNESIKQKFVKYKPIQNLTSTVDSK